MAKKDNGLMLLAGVAIIGLLAYQGGLFPSQTASIIDSDKQTVTVSSCGDTDGQADLQYRYKNSLNFTQADWHSTSAATLTLVDAETGEFKGDYAVTDVTGGYTTSANALVCGKSYYLAVVNSGNEVAVKSATFKVDDPKEQVTVDGAKSSEVNFNLYAFGSNTNETNAGQNAQDFTTVNVQTLGTSGTATLNYDVGAATAAGQFGSKERLCETSTGVCGKAFVCVTGSASIYNSGDLAITGPKIVGRTPNNVLPSLCQISAPSNAGVGRAAFETVAILNSDGRASGTVSVVAGLGNPGATDNVRFIWMDNSYYKGSDGKVKIGTADDTGTGTGETNRYFEIDIA